NRNVAWFHGRIILGDDGMRIQRGGNCGGNGGRLAKELTPFDWHGWVYPAKVGCGSLSGIMLGRQRVCCTQLAELFSLPPSRLQLLCPCTAKIGRSGAGRSATASGTRPESSRSSRRLN